ncbi:MAG: hypothetical protein M5U12_10315 [Verrucomicrobia bacterium]|nr:hypothetical protein [Verrucomicrobiota bacterium]
MSDILNKATVVVLNHNWQAINVRMPQEAGLKLLAAPRVPKELPATALIRNVHRIGDWELFVGP